MRKNPPYNALVGQPNSSRPLIQPLLASFGLLALLSNVGVAGWSTTSPRLAQMTAKKDASGNVTYVCDPFEVSEFALTTFYDSTRLLFLSAEAKFPFELVTIDATTDFIRVSGRLVMGQGTFPADVDLFKLTFTNLQPALPVEGIVFTTMGVAASRDFVKTIDPATLIRKTFTSAEIIPVTGNPIQGVTPITWDPNGVFNDGNLGGSGTWNTTSVIWDNLVTSAPLRAWNNVSNAHDLAVFSGNPTTGAVSINGTIVTGSLQFDIEGYNLGGTGTLTLNDGRVEINPSSSATISAVLAGGSGLSLTGGGTLTLSGVNTYSGVTTIGAGAVNIQSANALGSTAAGTTVTAGAALQLQGTIVTAAEALTLNGTGVAASGALRNISGANTYSGAVTLGSATRINSDSGTLTLNGATITGPTFALTVGGSGNTVINSVIATTTGGVTKDGPGTVTLTGANTYTGTTTVNGGILSANGTYTGGFVVNSGGHLTAARLNTGTLFIPTLLLGTGSAADFEFGVGGTLNSGHDIIAVANASGLTLGSTGLYLYQTGVVTPFTTNGTYTLFDYNTAFSGTLSTAFSIANSQIGKAYAVQNNAGATTIELVISDAASSTWTLNGGGVWSTAGNWSAGIPNTVAGVATFGSAITAPTVVSVDSPRTAGALVFNNANAYTLAGSTITLNDGLGVPIVSQVSGSHTISAPVALAAAATNLAAATGTTLTISGNISGAGGFNLTDAGTVALTGTNSYGSTTVSSGSLNVGNGGTAGTLGSGPVALGAGTQLTFNRTDTMTVANAISGAGALLQQGTGSTTLSGANTFTGTTTVAHGSLVASTAGGTALPGAVTLGTGAQNGIFLIMGATNQFGANSVLTFNNGINNGAKFELRGFSQTVAGLVSDTDDVFSIIQNQESGSPGTATLTINNTNDYIFTGLIRTRAGGALDVVKTGGGTQEVRNVPAEADNFGTVAVNAGNLTFNFSGATGSLGASTTVAVAPLATLGLDGTWTMARVISGEGEVLKQGAGAVTLTAANTYTGATTIATGQLTLNLPASLSAGSEISIAAGATLGLAGTGTIPRVISGVGSVVQQGAGTIVLTGANTYGNTTVNAGFLNVGSGGTTGTLGTGAVALGFGTTLTFNRSNVMAVPNAITGGGSVVQQGLGTTTLNGANTYTGTTTIAHGSLIAATAGGTAIPGNITLGGGLQNGIFLITTQPNQFGPNSIITFNNGTNLDAKFELRGMAQTVAGLQSDADDTLSIVQNQESGAPPSTTLTINATANYIFNGIIRNKSGGNLNVVKTGSGTQEIRNVAIQPNAFCPMKVSHPNGSCDVSSRELVGRSAWSMSGSSVTNDSSATKSAGWLSASTAICVGVVAGSGRARIRASNSVTRRASSQILRLRRNATIERINATSGPATSTAPIASTMSSSSSGMSDQRSKELGCVMTCRDGLPPSELIVAPSRPEFPASSKWARSSRPAHDPPPPKTNAP